MKLKFRKGIVRYRTVASALFVIHMSQCVAAQVDTAQSSILVISSQMGVPMTGRFREFSGTVHFDPARPAAGSATLSVRTASYDMENDMYSDQVRDRKWFDTARFPVATFVSTSIVPEQGGHYKVAGRLTIKAQSQDVIVPVTITHAGSSIVLDGSLPISRTQYGIGIDEWKDTSVVADSVVIKFHLISPTP